MFKTRVFMCVDAAGQAINLKSSLGTDPIEDAGLEVVEDQTADYDGDFSGVLTLRELLDSESNFVPYD